MANTFYVKKNNSTRTYSGGELVYVDAAKTKQVRQLYVKKDGTSKMVWQYDITKPTLTINQSTSSRYYTRNNSFTISGSASDTESGIKSVTVDGTVVSTSSGSWSRTVTLSWGDQTHTIVATDNAGNSTTAYVYTQYETTAPSISISSPSSTSSGSPTFTFGSSYTVTGTVSDANSGVASVYVNGVRASVNGNSWSATISLGSGYTTTVTATATDNAGNQASTSRYVRYFVTRTATGSDSSSSGGKTDAYSGTDFYAHSSGTITTGSYAYSKSLSFSFSTTGNQWPGPTKDTWVKAYNSSGGVIASASGTSLTLTDEQSRQCTYFQFHWDTEGRSHNIGAGQSYGFTAYWSWTQTYYA